MVKKSYRITAAEIELPFVDNAKGEQWRTYKKGDVIKAGVNYDGEGWFYGCDFNVFDLIGHGDITTA